MYLQKTHHPGKKALKFPVPSYLIGMLARYLVLMGGTLRKRKRPRFSPQPTYPPISGSIKVPITDIVRYQSLFVFCSWNAVISASLLAYFGEDNRFTAQFLRNRNCFSKCTNFPTNFSAAIFFWARNIGLSTLGRFFLFYFHSISPSPSTNGEKNLLSPPKRPRGKTNNLAPTRRNWQRFSRKIPFYLSILDPFDSREKLTLFVRSRERVRELSFFFYFITVTGGELSANLANARDGRRREIWITFQFGQ